MQQNGATIKELGVLAEEVYKNKYFLSSNLLVSNDEKLDYSYKVIATHADIPEIVATASGFQGMLVQNTVTEEYVFAFRGTELDSGVAELYKDLIIADIVYMGSGTVPQQMKDAMLFVHKMMEDNDGISAGNTRFTGHSLGGSIAGMASYVYGFDAYAYNGFGITNMLWDADDTSGVDHPDEMSGEGELPVSDDIYETLGEYLEGLGVEVKKKSEGITNVIHDGYAAYDVVGGVLTEILSGQEGDVHFVVNHNGDTGGIFDWENHKIAGLNDSIAIYNNVLELLPGEDYNSLSEHIRLLSPQDKRVERLLGCLGELGSVAALPGNHVDWSEDIKNSGLGSLTLNSRADSSVSSLESQAGSQAGMFGLLNLLPFTITGASYSHLNTEGGLDSGNYSEHYIEDRAAFLHGTMHENSAPVEYKDTGLDITVERGGSTGQGARHFVFGRDVGDTIGVGKQALYGESDHLYDSSPKAFSPHRAVFEIAA